MPRIITAIRIDPFQHTVEAVKYDASDYRNLYPLLSAPEHPVDLFTTAPFFGQDAETGEETLFVDDEGLFKTGTGFFAIDGAYQPYAGCGVIVGTDDEGETVSTGLTAAEVRARVQFLTPLI